MAKKKPIKKKPVKKKPQIKTKPIKKITKTDIKKGIKEEEKYEKIVRDKAGKKMPLQARVGLKVKDKAMEKVKKKI